MASERILAVGKIEHGQVIILTKHHQVEQMFDSISDEDWARYEAGSPLGAPLQDFIDYAAELEDQIEGRLDEDYWRSGCW